MNITITKGVKGTSQPIPSIIRNWRKILYSSVWNQQLSQNREKIEYLFPSYSRFLFKNTIASDKNPSKLAKIVNLENNCIENWIESCFNRTSKNSNYIVQIILDGKIILAKIINIQKNLTDEIEFGITRIHIGKLSHFELPVYKVLRETEQGTKIKINSILAFYCLVNFQENAWVFPFD